MAKQVVDVSDYAATIDDDEAEATLSALLGGWQSQEDSATVTAIFRSRPSRRRGRDRTDERSAP